MSVQAEPAAQPGDALDVIRASIPQRLRAGRESSNLSVRELARRVSISPSAISQIETGRTRPSVSTLYAIVTELNLSLDELFAHDGHIAARGPGGPRLETVVREQDREALEFNVGVRWERLTASPQPNLDF